MTESKFAKMAADAQAKKFDAFTEPEEEEPDYLPGEYSFDFKPLKDITAYEVLLVLPILLNMQNPLAGTQLLALLNEHRELRRHWPRSSSIITVNGLQAR